MKPKNQFMTFRIPQTHLLKKQEPLLPPGIVDPHGEDKDEPTSNKEIKALLPIHLNVSK